MDDKDKDCDSLREDILKLADLVGYPLSGPINNFEDAKKLTESIEQHYKIIKRNDTIDKLLNEENE